MKFANKLSDGLVLLKYFWNRVLLGLALLLFGLAPLSAQTATPARPADPNQPRPAQPVIPIH